MNKYRARSSLPWFRRRYYRTKLHNLLVERLRAGYDFAGAIEYLHDRRIMHRDIKLSNLGYDADGVLRCYHADVDPAALGIGCPASCRTRPSGKAWSSRWPSLTFTQPAVSRSPRISHRAAAWSSGSLTLS